MLFTKQLKIMAARVTAFVARLGSPLTDVIAIIRRVKGLLDRFESQGYVELNVRMTGEGLNVRVKLPEKRKGES